MQLVPERYREKVRGFALEVDGIVSNFLHGQIVVAAILAGLYALGLWLVADVPLGLVIGLFAGLAAIVPYLGVVLGVIPRAGAWQFLQHQDLKHPLLVVVVFAVAQALEGNLITPKIVGDKVGPASGDGDFRVADLGAVGRHSGHAGRDPGHGGAA